MNARSAVVADANNENSVEVEEAIKRLYLLLGAERLVQLTQMLDDVAADTRFGNVTIVITDGRIRLLKAEKSYE